MTGLTVSLQRSTKELIRHALATSGLSWVHIGARIACGQNLAHLRAKSIGERFEAIYRNGAWQSHDRHGSLSGPGSSMAATEGIRKQLPNLLVFLKTQVLLDVGCGDFLWMNDITLPCPYIGVDIVPAVIKLNVEHYSCAGRSFHVVDATNSPLPAANTVLCREMLFHLSFQDIWKTIANIKRGGAMFLLATNDEGVRFNSDILTGDFRLLNLLRAPFSFPRPVLAIPDNAVNPDRVISVWDTSALP
jgi:hypothetical protein